MVIGNGIGLAPPLNEHQARSLMVGVRRLQEILDQLDRLLGPSQAAQGALVLVEADIPQTLIGDLSRQADLLRAEIEALAGLLAIAPEHRSARRTFAALASSAWTVAEDLHPAKLRAYGEVEPVAVAVLAPRIERIAEGFRMLAARVAEAPAEPPDPPGGSGAEG